MTATFCWGGKGALPVPTFLPFSPVNMVMTGVYIWTIFGFYFGLMYCVSESTFLWLDNKFLNDYATSLSPQKLVRGIDKYLIGVRMVWYGMMHPATCWHNLSPIIYELPSRPIDIWLKPYCRWIVWKGHLHLPGPAIHAALSIIMIGWHLLQWGGFAQHP